MGLNEELAGVRIMFKVKKAKSPIPSLKGFKRE
jgi:hypothetical protein